MPQLATREEGVNKFKLFFARGDVLAQFHRAIRPGHEITAQTVARIALTTLTDPRNASLLECSERSVCASIVTALALGLEPDNVSGLAYLVPYGKECKLIPGYQGMIQLALRSGQVADFSTYNVYACEPFDRDTGRDREIQHTPLPPSKRGPYIGSYAKVKLNTGGTHYEWMWAEEIEAIRQKSPGKNSPAWKNHADEMRRKTVARRAFKYVPRSPVLQRMLNLDAQVEAGIPQNFDMIDVEPIGEPQELPKPKPSLKDYTDKSKTKATKETAAPVEGGQA